MPRLCLKIEFHLSRAARDCRLRVPACQDAGKRTAVKADQGSGVEFSLVEAFVRLSAANTHV